MVENKKRLSLYRITPKIYTLVLAEIAGPEDGDGSIQKFEKEADAEVFLRETLKLDFTVLTFSQMMNNGISGLS